jgi:hypothetical protein
MAIRHGIHRMTSVTHAGHDYPSLSSPCCHVTNTTSSYRLSPIAYRHHDSLQRHLKALPPALLPWVGVEDALARQPPVAPLVDVVLDLGFGVPGSGSGFGVRGMAHSI